MFKVLHEETKEIYNVFAVKKEENVTKFLFHNGDKKFPIWYWEDADNYYPVNNER